MIPTTYQPQIHDSSFDCDYKYEAIENTDSNIY